VPTILNAQDFVQHTAARRSVRRLKGRSLPEPTYQASVQAALWTTSNQNTQHWQCISLPTPGPAIPRVVGAEQRRAGPTYGPQLRLGLSSRRAGLRSRSVGEPEDESRE